MTAFKTPSAAQLATLASLSDADLMAPLTFDGAAPDPVLTPVSAERFIGVPVVPALEPLLAQARKVQDISVAADLPARTARVTGVPAGETVSPIMRATGGRLSEALRTAAGEHIKSADDLEYALRVFAAHALNSLLLNRRSDLAFRERTAAETIHTNWQDRLRVAAVGELAAIDAAQHLSSEEFQFLLELVDTGRAGMAQNLAGPAVNVSALVAGYGCSGGPSPCPASHCCGVCMSRARNRIEARNKMPEIKPWHEEYTLSDTSPSGLRYLVNGIPSVVAGSPKEPTWPHNESMAQHCIWPRHFGVSVLVDWEGIDLGGFMAWDMQLETVSAWVVREILLEHAERDQQIQLLEQHLEVA